MVRIFNLYDAETARNPSTIIASEAERRHNEQEPTATRGGFFATMAARALPLAFHGPHAMAEYATVAATASHSVADW